MRRPFFAALVAVLSLSACGGGSDSLAGASPFPDGQPGPPAPPPPPPPPAVTGEAEGFWTGSTSTGRSFDALVTASGDVWAVYGDGGVALGAIKGTIIRDAGGQLQATGTDYYIAGGRTYSGTMSGSYTPAGTMSGSYSGGAPGTFTAAYDARYDSPVGLADVAGSWQISSASTAGNVTTTLRVDAAGNVAATTPLCTLSGTISPAANGKGYFVTSTSFAGAQCPYAGISLPGIATLTVTGSIARLGLAAVSADGAVGYIAIGTR